MKFSLRSRFSLSLLLSVVLTACGGGSDSGGGGNATVNPSLSGQPQTQLNEMDDYQFSAQATGFSEQITYSIENLPSWASFNPSTGVLTGTPNTNDAGTYSNIRISASDGTEQASLSTFSIEVIDLLEISGKVVDGYISGALVYVDQNNNLQFDEGEISVYSDDEGEYTLYCPQDQLDAVAKSPIRAYIGAGARDLSRPELDFSVVPITLSLPPVDINASVANKIEGQIISPFSNRLVEQVTEVVNQFNKGEITQNELTAELELAKTQVLEEVMTQANISESDTNFAKSELSDIVFGDFVQFKQALPSLLKQGEKWVDAVIDASDERDFDNDGQANNVDPDNDNDGVNDEDDAFPLDETESLDSDGDGVGNKADAYPNDANCSIAAHGNGSECYFTSLGKQSIEVIEAGESGVVYFYISAGWLWTLDSTDNTLLNIQQMDGITAMEYDVENSRLYIGDNSGSIRYLNSNYQLSEFATVDSCVQSLIKADKHLVALDCSGYNGEYIVFDNIGNKTGQSQSYYDTSTAVVWDNQHRLLFHFRDGISPNDIHSTSIDANGVVGSTKESPYHGYYSIQGPITLSYDSSLVLLGSGDLYDTSNLNWVGAVTGQFDSANWLSDGSLLTYHANSLTTTIYRRDSAYRIVEMLDVPGQILQLIVNDDATETTLVLRQNNQINFYTYQPTDDSDNDGVFNIDDAFPTDASASVDTDGDGYPNAWNEGKSATDSTRNLTLDAFPSDSACWLDTHSLEDGLCDYGATMPVFTPDHIISDEDGNVYLLNKSASKIYFWSSEQQVYRNPINVGTLSVSNVNLAPTKMAYSHAHNRIYLGYTTGEINYVDLDAPSQEVYLTNIAMSVNGLAAVGNYILAQDDSGALGSHHIIDRNGVITDSQEWNYYSRVYAWNEANSRVYFFRDGISPNDLHFEVIDQSSGRITAEGESPYHGDYGIVPPIVISNDNNKVFLGNGDIYDANTMEYQGSLDENLVDLVSMPGLVIGLKQTTSSSAQVLIWLDSAQGYALVNRMSYQGSPHAILKNGHNLTIVTQTSVGLNFNSLVLEDADQDGLPAWWEQAYGLSDDDNSDAELDSDNDGLTNLQEFNLITLPDTADSDNDGLIDGVEVNTYQTDPLVLDTDMDGLTDGDEVNTHQTNPLAVDSDDDELTDADEINKYQSNPLSNDSDGDGLLDSYEITNGLDINVDDATSDTDEDGLNNFDESLAGTDPTVADTDNDGLSDGAEVHTYSTEPLNRDSDGDSVDDGWEITYAFDPLAATDQLSDFDADGYSNQHEYFLGSDPTDAASVPLVQGWTSYRANAAHNGFVGLQVNPEHLSVRWSADVSNHANRLHPVVAANGKVVTSSTRYFNNQSVLTLSAITGQVENKINLGSIHDVSAVSIADDSIYFQTSGHEDSFLYGYDINTGYQLFASPYANQWSNHPAPSIYEGKVFMAGGYYGGLYKFDANSGDEIWFQDKEQCDGWVPSVDEHHVYHFTGGFYIANKQTGVIEHSNTEFDTYACTTPVLGNANNAFVIDDGSLYAFDTQTAAIKWQDTSERYDDRYLGLPVAALDKVYALKDGQLLAIDAFSGERLWTWKPANERALIGQIAASINLIFVQDGFNTYAVDISTQQQVWSYPISGDVTIAKEGSVYITSGSEIIAFDIGEDSDQDGIFDWWEDLYGLDKLDGTDAGENLDDDELTNLEEFTNGTNPLIDDTDSDGLSDSDEVNQYASNPTSVDSDKDGMFDGWEVSNGLNLIDASDAHLDFDDDTILNIDEYLESTDPNDASSLPDAIVNQVFSFENNKMPAEWTIDNSLESSWGVTALHHTDGTKSIFSSGSAAFSYTGYFNGNRLSFDAKVNTNCGSSTRIYVYVGDEIVSETHVFEKDGWVKVQATVARGRHPVRLFTSCGGYIDNVKFEPLDDLLDAGINYLLVNNMYINGYDFEQNLTSKIRIPDSDYSQDFRDIVVAENGSLILFRGGNTPALLIYNALYGTWDTYELVGSNHYYISSVGLATVNNKIFISVPNGDNLFAGIVEFDLTTRELTTVTDSGYRDVVVAENGNLYALGENHIDIYDPLTMELQDSFVIDSATSIAVDAQGNIYTVNTNRTIVRYDNLGVQNRTFDLAKYFERQYYFSHFVDMEIDERGNLYVLDEQSHVVQSTTDLRQAQVLQATQDGYTSDSLGRFMALAPAIDEDLDGMPKWWEDKYGLSDSDESDAQLDSDAEGLVNIDEYRFLTDPNVSDTDDDGIDDYSEIHTYAISPTNVDSDGDGLADGYEVNQSLTNPANVDSDLDGFDDGKEINLYETDPNDASSVPDAITSLNINFDDQIVPSFLTQPNSSTTPWGLQVKSTSDYILASGTINHNQRSGFAISGLFANGEFSFDARVSSESCCDYLAIYLNGEIVLRVHENQWQNYTIDLQSGEHTIEFAYLKDGSASSNDDKAYVDNIVFEN